MAQGFNGARQDGGAFVQPVRYHSYSRSYQTGWHESARERSFRYQRFSVARNGRRVLRAHEY